MSKTALKTASVLAFERNLDVSDAYLWQTDSQAGDNSAKSPVVIKEKSVRGTISNRLKNAPSPTTLPSLTPKLKKPIYKR